MDISRRPSADVLPFETLASKPVVGASPPLGEFPYYVEPADDEALLSWLLRLATRMQVSLHTLAEHCFGVDDRQGHSQWWCRPHPWVLKRISQRTGVSVARLRRMTFATFAPVYRDDEVNERFNGQRYFELQPDRRANRFAVCGRCLEEDTQPYIRWQWLLGWVAVCPHHACVLVARCTSCNARCHPAHFAHVANFAPRICTRCGEALFTGDYQPASPSVIYLQTILLQAKCEGAAELEGIGVLTWAETVALVDVLLGMFWTTRTPDEREDDMQRFYSAINDGPSDTLGAYDGRNASLRLLAWLTDGWPSSDGAQLGQQMLTDWLHGGTPNGISAHLRGQGRRWTSTPDDFGPTIRGRLAALLD